MTFRLFALAAATSIAVLASPAAAQSPVGPRATGFVSMGGSPSEIGLNCRSRPYECGVRAYNYFGPRESIAWFQRGARRGSAPSMRSLGFILLRGEGGVRADPEAAMGWLYEAALRRDAMAMYALSVGFDEGLGVERDPGLARFWLERAALAGNQQARQALRRSQ